MTSYTSSEQQKRALVGRRASVVGIMVNILLCALKIIFGSIIGSLSMLADGINNLTDTASSLVTYISLKISSKPKDIEHPFGHGRAESIGALAVGVLILSIGLEILKSGIASIFVPRNVKMNDYGSAILILSVVMKLVIWYFYKKLGKKYDLLALKASAQDSLSDVITSLSILLSLSIDKHIANKLDSVLCIGIAIIIFFNGGKILKDTIYELIGRKPDDRTGKALLEIIKEEKCFLDYHDFIIHEYGKNKAFASIHVTVSQDSNLLALHESMERIEKKAIEKLGIPICIHVDPQVREEYSEIFEKIDRYVREHYPHVRVHDFMVNKTKNKQIISYHLLIPSSEKEPETIVDTLSSYTNQLHPSYCAAVEFDVDYFI